MQNSYKSPFEAGVGGRRQRFKGKYPYLFKSILFDFGFFHSLSGGAEFQLV